MRTPVLFLLMSGWIAVQAGAAGGMDRETLFRSLDVMDWVGKPVSDSRWRQVARVERLLFDPGSGRATFVVLSFVGRDGLWAVPWSEVSVDSRGRARLRADESAALERSIPYHADHRYASSTLESPHAVARDPAGSRGVALRANGSSDELLRGRVMGLASLPAESGGRRTVAFLEIADGIVRVDLGSESALRDRGIEIRAGDAVEVIARRRSQDELVAIGIRGLESIDTREP